MNESKLMELHKLIVVDSLMGTGKTTAMFQFINERPDQRFIFVTPYRKEIKRVVSNTHGRLIQPNGLDGPLNISLNTLLASKKDVAMTHTLLTYANPETVQLIKDGDYIIVLDEAMECFKTLESVTKILQQRPLTNGDLTFLLKNNFIEIVEESGLECGQIRWLADQPMGSYYEEIARMAKLRSLYCVTYNPNKPEQQAEVFWEYPYDVFAAAKNIFVLTYLYEGSLIDGYFYCNNEEPYLISTKMIDGRSEFCLYYDSPEMRFEIADKLLTVHVDLPGDRRKLNEDFEGSTCLSASYLRELHESGASGRKVKRKLNGNMDYFCKHYPNDDGTACRKEQIGWSTLKEITVMSNEMATEYRQAYPDGIRGKEKYDYGWIVGFRQALYVCSEAEYNAELSRRQNIYQNAQKQLKKMKAMYRKGVLPEEQYPTMIECQEIVDDGEPNCSDLLLFLPHNARASNDFRQKNRMMYLYNRYQLPGHIALLSRRGFHVNGDRASLGDFLQWIWRSAIRDGLPVVLYVPSGRMRALLLEWLGVDEKFYQQRRINVKKQKKLVKVATDPDKPKKRRGRPPKIKLVEENENESTN